MTKQTEQTEETKQTAVIDHAACAAISVIENPFEPHARETTWAPAWGQPLAEVLPERVTRDPNWVVVQDGRILTEPEWADVCLHPGSEIICYSKIDNATTRIIAGYLIILTGVIVAGLGAPEFGFGIGVIGAGYLAGGIVDVIIGPPAVPTFGSQEAGSPTYGFGTIRNGTRLGSSIPVVYGLHRIGGQYIQLFTKTENDNDVLHALIAVSEGEIEAIDPGGHAAELKINGQPSSSYHDLTIDTRLGTNTQTAIDLFGDSTTTIFAADAAITESDLDYTMTGKNVTAFEINLTFPQGLFKINDEGGLSKTKVLFSVYYRLVGAGGWTELVSGWLIEAKKRAVLRRSIRSTPYVAVLPAGQYEIRIKRLSPESTSLRRTDAVRRTSINEIVNDTYLYPNVALVAVKAVATDQISGGLPTITTLVKGRKLRVWSSATQYSIIWSDNPAWAVFDILTQRRFGMGNFVWPLRTRDGTVSVDSTTAVVLGSGTSWLGKVTKGDKLVVDAQGRLGTVLTVDSNTQITLTAVWPGSTASGLAYEIHRNDLDIQSFVNWAAFCDALVDNGQGGTEKRATYNGVFDAANEQLWDAVQQIAGIGFAALVKLGNYIVVRYQQAESHVQLFTMANIVRGSFRESFLPLKERANVFEVQFKNAANDYEDDTVMLEDPAIFTNSEPERKQMIGAKGVTRSSHAARIARFHYRGNRLITRLIEFQVGIDAIVVEPGDVFRFQHDVPQWGFGNRAASGSGASTIVLDAAVTLAAGPTYQVLVKHADDTVEIKTVTNGAGTYTTLTISGTWTQNPADGEVVAVGQTGIAVKPFRAIAIERTNEMTGKIIGLEYDAALFDETDLTPVNQVQYSTLPNPLAPPDHVTDLVLSQLDDARQTVAVTFTPPADSRYHHAAVYRLDEGVNESLGDAVTGQFQIPGLPPGTVLTVKVVSVSRQGSHADWNAAPSATITVSTGARPPDVSGLELVGQGNDATFVGKDAKFRWHDRARTGGLGLEPLGQETLGIGAGLIDPLFKQYRVEIYNTGGLTLRRLEYTVNADYVYSYERNYEDARLMPNGAVVRTFTLKVWQQDIFNQLSVTPAILTVANAAPGIVDNFTATALERGVLVKWDPSAEIDVTGYRVHRSTSGGFTPDDTNLVYDGPNTLVASDNLVNGTTYYFKVAAYDTFGKTGLTYSGQVSGAPSGLLAANIAGTIGALQQNLGLVQIASGTFTNNSPGGGSIAWSSIVLLYNGVSYTIADGNTSGKWLYWTAGQGVFTASASLFPTLGNTDFLIGWNDSGTFKALWNNWLRSGVITGDLIAGLTILAANIAAGTITVDKLTVSELSAITANLGTITAGLIRDTASKFLINLATRLIEMKDEQGSPVTRVRIGEVGAGAGDWGIEIFNSAGTKIFGTAGLEPNTVTKRAEARAGQVTTNTTSFEDLVTVNVTTTGGSVIILGRTLNITDGSTSLELRLVRDSTEIDDVQAITVGSAQAVLELIATDLDTPTAGTYTYKLQGRRAAGSGNVVWRHNALLATEYLA